MSNRSCLFAAWALIALAGALPVFADTPDPAAALLKDADERITDLQQKKTFFTAYRAEALLAQRAAVAYSADPRLALWYAREINEPFFASLAVGACAVQAIPSDPDAALDLMLGAQERALSIEHYTGSDGTSLNYLFQATPLFPKDHARKLLISSRRNLAAWIGAGSEKREPALELTRHTLALDPAGVDALLKVLNETPQATHLSESFRLISAHFYKNRHAWAMTQVDAFYASRKSFLAADGVLHGLLLEDAVNDPAAALLKINGMHPSDQGMARVLVAEALHAAGKVNEAAAQVADLQKQAEAPGNADEQLARLVAGCRDGWEREKAIAALPHSAPIEAQEIDAFAASPTFDAWRLQWVGKQLVFRDAAQARKFVDAALPLARQVQDMGYPHHGSPRSQGLGVLAYAAAMAGDVERAKAIADEIDIPELRAFYLLTAYEAVHPLPEVVRGWPLWFFPPAEVRIAAAAR